MKLAYWMYLGPAHIGTLRVACSFKNVHSIMHAPLGDDYFNVMRSMLERQRETTPVTTSVVDRHVLARGSQAKVINNMIHVGSQKLPDLILLTPTCTSSILQEDLQNFVFQAKKTTNLDILLADVNHYRVNELEAADCTLEQIVSFYLHSATPLPKTKNPSVNIIGALNLSFHHQHDLAELKRLLLDLGIEVNLIIPEGASVHDLIKLSKGWVNIVPYREVGHRTAKFLEKEWGIPFIDISPIGINQTSLFIQKLAYLLNKVGNSNLQVENYIDRQTRFISQATWFAHSIDCQNLTGKRAVVFGDVTHVVAITKILVQEVGIKVVLAGTFCKEHDQWFNEQIGHLVDEVLVTDDHTIVSNLISKLDPAVIFGTQMERHVAKRLNIPCSVISSPVHIQNFPLSYNPFFGYEGANQIADLIYNSFILGMEDHLLELFSGHDTKPINSKSLSDVNIIWEEEAKSALLMVPSFVRKKVKQSTEKYALDHNETIITLSLMYKAKENSLSL